MILSKDKLIKLWLNLDEKLANVCLSLPGVISGGGGGGGGGGGLNEQFRTDRVIPYK
jgi:hypothetical protein